MHKHTARLQRRALWGWIKWVPVVAIPFSILFFHAWINIQVLRADYVLRELNAQAEKLEERLEHTGLAETIHEDPEVLAERAEMLGFIQPQPGQREIIHYSPATPSTYEDASPFAIAQRDATPVPEPAVDESQTSRSAAQPVVGEVPAADTAVTVSPSPTLAPATTETPAAPASVETPVVLQIDAGLESLNPSVATPVERPAEVAIQADQIDTLRQERFIDPMDADMGALESL